MLSTKLMIALSIIMNRPMGGPMEVAIDVTNNCTMKCITCWNYSPLNQNQPSEDWKNTYITFEKFKELADYFGKSGVTRIMIGGDGDPFLHTQIIEILEAAKSTSAQVSVATKGAYFSDLALRKLINMEFDSLNISILSASEEVFIKIHPEKNPKLFKKIVNDVKSLTRLKKEFNKQKPIVGLVFVVCKFNYHEVDKVMDLANELRVDYVVYKRISVFTETMHLLLSQADLAVLNFKLKIVKQKSRAYGIDANVDEFNRTTIAGLSSGKYSDTLYKKIPCYVGWSYARILINGNVIPCCGCFSKVLGNIYKDGFDEIWKSDNYAGFRTLSRRITCSNGEISGCSCRSCIHAGSNFGIFRRFHPFKARKIFSF